MTIMGRRKSGCGDNLVAFWVATQLGLRSSPATGIWTTWSGASGLHREKGFCPRDIRCPMGRAPLSQGLAR